MLRKILAASSAVVLGLSFQGCSSSDGGGGDGDGGDGDGGGGGDDDNDNCNWTDVDTSDAAADEAKLQQCISCLESKSGVDVDNDAGSGEAAFSALTCDQVTTLLGALENCDADSTATDNLTNAANAAGC